MTQHQQRRVVRQDRRQDQRARRQGRRQAAAATSGSVYTPPASTSVDPASYEVPQLPPTPGAGQALPQGGVNTPFYDPASNYVPSGSTGNVLNYWESAGQPGSSVGNIYGSDQSPEGYYFGLLNQQGLGGFDARSRAAQSMYSDYARGYQAAKMKNSELFFPQYMQMQDIPGLIQLLSDEQLGIDRNNVQGGLNWSLRG